LNSQVVLIKTAFKSNGAFIVVASAVAASLFLKSGFISVSVIWFCALCVNNYTSFSKGESRNYYLLFLPVMLYGIYLGAVAHVEDSASGTNLLLRKIHLILLPLSVIAGRQKISQRLTDIIFFIFLVACLLATVICIIAAIFRALTLNLPHHAGGLSHFFSHMLAAPLNMSAVYLSMYCNFALLITLSSSLFKRPVFKATVAVYLFIFTFLCLSIAGVVGACIIILLWLLVTKQNKNFFYALAIVSATVIAVGTSKPALIADVFKFRYTDENGRLSGHTGDRLKIWSASLNTILNGPLLGYGTSAGQYALEQTYSNVGLLQEKNDHLNSHNQFLSTALDLGLLGVIVLIAMLMLPLVYAIRKKSAIAAGFSLIILIFFCVESMLLRQKGIVFFSFFYSVLLCQALQEKTPAAWLGSSVDSPPALI
jgi:O-antigen ligase